MIPTPKDLIYVAIVKFHVCKSLMMLSKAEKEGQIAPVLWETGVLYDKIYGRPSNSLPTRTPISIPSWIISNEGIRALRFLGYDLCYNCTGQGWDADWGGVFTCPDCKGIGIQKGAEPDFPKGYWYKTTNSKGQEV